MSPELHRGLASVAALLLAAALPFASSGCNREPLSHTDQEVVVSVEDPTFDADQEVVVSVEDPTFDADQQAWRDQRREGLLAPDGWASLTGLHWITPGEHGVGSDSDNAIQLTMGPAHLGVIELRGRELRFVPEAAGDQTVDGERLSGPVALRSDDDEAGPSVLGFDAGKGLASVILRNDRYALRVRHADASTRIGFSGLSYWPMERDWVIAGKFIPHPPGRIIEVANVLGAFDPSPNPGALEFQRDGKTYRLEAIDDGGGELFLVFGDRTNGTESYGAGRFLYAPLPDAEGRTTLDFNRAYSPPCAFTTFATCPLPPPENPLDLAVTAGEKKYTPGK